MRLKDCKCVFGIDLSLLKTEQKKYRKWESIAFLSDVLLLTLGFFLIGQSAPILIYLLLCVLLALSTNLLVALITRSDYRQVFSFYNKYKYRKCEEKYYEVTNENLFAILFCAGYTRVKPDQSRDTYLECMRSACCMNNKYARRIAKYLTNYESEGEGNLKCVLVTEGKIQFVDIMEV